MKPEISVIVPVYNVESWLAECLSSIANQQESSFEVWLVNDGSTDGSLKILEQYVKEDARFHVVTRVNGGLSAARNAGLSHATGEYVCFVDSDDVIDPGYLKQLYEAAVQNHAEIAVCDMEYFDETGKRSFSSGGDFSHTSVREMPSLIGINNSACNKLFKRSLFEQLQFPEGKYYEDLATVPVLLYRAKWVVKVNRALYFYRQRSGSIAHKANPKLFEIYDAIDGVMNTLKQDGIKEGDPLLEEVRHFYVIHGLDLTTLRIKDFEEKEIRPKYLQENMLRLQQSYPDYEHDNSYIDASAKKRLIWKLLKQKHYGMVLKIYG